MRYLPRFRTVLTFGWLLLTAPLWAQEKQVMIQVIQDASSPLSEFQTNLLLERRPFKFQVLLRNVEGVYVFASIQDSVYRFTETSVIRDFPYLELLKLRDEDVFNTHRELSISETGWSYWYYKPDPEPHAFNRKVVRLDSGRVVCTKQVRNLYSTNEGRVIRLRDVRTPLYLFFVAVSGYDEYGRPRLEMLRRKVKIDWVDAD